MRHICKAALLAALSFAALPAYADDEIVVTATRTPTPARNLPADVTVVDTDTALARGQTTLAQAIEETPGLGVAPSGGIGQQTSVFTGGANSDHTLVLFDGLRINDPSTPNSSFDAGQDQINALARVEIVEGPMSAVFGSDAIGGVINLVPRHGGEGPINARLNLSAGSFATLTGAASVDGTLGRLRYAVTGEGYTSDGYDLVPKRMSTHVGDADGADMTALTGVFDVDVSDAFALDLLVRQRRARADFDPFLFDASFNEFRADDADLEISRNDLTLARLGANWTLSDTLTLRATGGGMDQEREQRDGGLVTDTFEGQRRFADLTLEWRPGAAGGLDDVAMVAGVSGEREEVDVAQGFGFPPPSFFTSAKQEQQSAFVTGQGRVGRASLTGAMRVDDYEGFGANTTWRLGVSFDVAAAARVYASYGTSFRAPTLYERFVSFGNQALDPEQGESWEVGADARVAAFGQPEGVELGLLYRNTEIENLIDFGPFFTYENVDLAHIESAEARFALRPAAWLTLHAAYTYTDAEDVGAGAPLLRRPRDAWFAAAEVHANGFTGRLSWRNIGERFDIIYGDDGFAQGQGFTPAYDVVRLSAAYDVDANAQAYIAVENAFDETYEPVNAFAGTPRSLLVGVRLRAGR